jgi:hypothetical protein
MRIEGIPLHESFVSITEPSLGDWKKGTQSAVGYSYCIASSVIQDLELALRHESLMEKAKRSKTRFPRLCLEWQLQSSRRTARLEEKALQTSFFKRSSLQDNINLVLKDEAGSQEDFLRF